MTMKSTKRKKLESAGWTVGDAADFLELTPEEENYIDSKLALARKLKAVREARKESQAAFAKVIHSSQSRVAKMEAGDPSVSMDLLVKSLYAVGMSPKRVGKVLAAA
jgi:DNA-binding XRE family transcriptional regulator